MRQHDIFARFSRRLLRSTTRRADGAQTTGAERKLTAGQPKHPPLFSQSQTRKDLAITDSLPSEEQAVRCKMTALGVSIAAPGLDPHTLFTQRSPFAGWDQLVLHVIQTVQTTVCTVISI